MTLEQGTVVLLAYLVGSVPFGFFLVRWRRGGDIRVRGSGNIGSANVVREAGWRLGIATLLLDAGKGVVAAVVARRVAASSPLIADVAALAATVGHVYPPWLRFRGGKGVATACGAFGALHPVPMLCALGVFTVVTGLSRHVSAGSLAASAGFPAFEAWRGAGRGEVALGIVAAMLILWAHRENLTRLSRGEESRL